MEIQNVGKSWFCQINSKKTREAHQELILSSPFLATWSLGISTVLVLPGKGREWVCLWVTQTQHQEGFTAREGRWHPGLFPSSHTLPRQLSALSLSHGARSDTESTAIAVFQHGKYSISLQIFIIVCDSLLISLLFLATCSTLDLPLPKPVSHSDRLSQQYSQGGSVAGV